MARAPRGVSLPSAPGNSGERPSGSVTASNWPFPRWWLWWFGWLFEISFVRFGWFGWKSFGWFGWFGWFECFSMFSFFSILGLNGPSVGSKPTTLPSHLRWHAKAPQSPQELPPASTHRWCEPHPFGKANNFSIGLRTGLENPKRAGVRRWRQVFHFLKTKKKEDYTFNTLGCWWFWCSLAPKFLLIG